MTIPHELMAAIFKCYSKLLMASPGSQLRAAQTCNLVKAVNADFVLIAETNHTWSFGCCGGVNIKRRMHVGQYTDCFLSTFLIVYKYCATFLSQKLTGVYTFLLRSIYYL